MGPINGEISMAPIITAVEPVSKPIDANNAEQTINHAFVPLTGMFSSMAAAVFS